jgi:hypothetical protein
MKNLDDDIIVGIRKPAASKNPVALATKAVTTIRLAECSNCRHLRKPIWQCDQCGCFMQAKCRIAAASCPIGKW